jgi:hypothetical protein
MAAGAADGEAEEGGGADVGDVVEDVLADEGVVGAVRFFGVEAEPAGGDEGVGLVGFEFVAGELLPDEAVVGEVVVEGADDVVADVEPVLGPAFAETGRGEEAVDDFFVGVWAGVGEEGVALGGGRGEAGEVEGDATQQGDLFGLGIGVQAVLFEAGEHKGVDRVVDPGGVFDGRGGGAGGRSERPGGGGGVEAAGGERPKEDDREAEEGVRHRPGPSRRENRAGYSSVGSAGAFEILLGKRWEGSCEFAGGGDTIRRRPKFDRTCVAVAPFVSGTSSMLSVESRWSGKCWKMLFEVDKNEQHSTNSGAVDGRVIRVGRERVVERRMSATGAVVLRVGQAGGGLYGRLK